MRDLVKFRYSEHKVKVVNNEIAAFRSAEVEKSGARIFSADGLVAAASCVGEVSDATLYDRCQANRDMAQAAEVVPQGSHKQTWSTKCEKGIGPERALELAHEHVELLSRGLPNFTIQGHVSTTWSSRSYQNERGANLSREQEVQEFSFELRRKGSPNIIDGAVGNASLLSSGAKEDLAWTVDFFQKFDTEARVKPGRHKVLMLPDGSTIGKLCESLKADGYCEETALYSKRKGEKLFSEKFSLSDLRNVPERGAHMPFDLEGSVAKGAKTPLIEKGVFTGLVSDLVNEKRHGMATTANGFRTYNSSVRLSFNSVGLEAGKRGAREILRDAGEVIVSFMAYGGDLTAQGDFSTPIQLAFLCRNGEIVGKLPALSMSSSLARMYGPELLEVASDGPCRYSPETFLLSEMDIQVM